MKKKIGLFVVVLLAAAVLLSACGGGGSNDKAVGKWKSPEFEAMFGGSAEDFFGKELKTWIEFTKDGKILYMIEGKSFNEFAKEKAKEMGISDTSSMPQMDISYKINGDKMTLKFQSGDEKNEQVVTVKFEGDKMILENDGEKVEFTREK